MSTFATKPWHFKDIVGEYLCNFVKLNNAILNILVEEYFCNSVKLHNNIMKILRCTFAVWTCSTHFFISVQRKTIYISLK